MDLTSVKMIGSEEQTKWTDKLAIYMYDKAWNVHTTEFDKLAIYMYDKAWNVHTTEFDIVEEGSPPLWMSLLR